MKPLCKLIAVVLLLTVLSPAIPQVYLAAQTAQPAGCHKHSQKAPAPNPATYQCCRAAHQFAAVREAVDSRSSFVQLSSVSDFVVPASLGIVGPTPPKAPVFGSPGVTSLRI
jgi:hypothetical protein